MSESEPPQLERERSAPEIAVENLSFEEREKKLAELRPFKSRMWVDRKGKYEVMREFINRLMKKYDFAVYSKCELFHFISGGTVMPKDRPDTFFDFTGDDSVERFIREEGAKA